MNLINVALNTIAQPSYINKEVDARNAQRPTQKMPWCDFVIFLYLLSY